MTAPGGLINNLPNLITIMRILLVPFTVWLMITQSFGAALAAFVVAGVSDAIDGAIARRFNAQSELGEYLDPLADKALLVSIYVVLGIEEVVPAWLVILIVTRDVLIVGAVMLAWVLDKPVAMKPLLVSKINTGVQIIFAAFVLAMLSWDWEAKQLLWASVIAVAALTVASGGLYMYAWINHMTSANQPGTPNL